jgi:hypothetical protein
MIRLQDPGERGGELTVTMTPFDLLSLQEACMRGIAHGLDRADEYQKKVAAAEPGVERSVRQELLDAILGRVKDDRANYEELQRVLDERNERLG